MVQLHTPHIALGTRVDEALPILQRLGQPRQEDVGRERSYRVDSPLFSIAIYPQDDVVCSVWYDDPTGRDSDAGRAEKIEAYLARYGAIGHWELRLDNGWMHYWFNASDRAQMVYGLHKDVIRFNQYIELNA